MQFMYSLFDIVDASFAPPATNYDPFALSPPSMQQPGSAAVFSPPSSQAPPSSAFALQQPDVFDPFFSPSSGPSQPSQSSTSGDIFDPFGTSAFAAPTSAAAPQQPVNQSEEDDFFAVFTSAPPPVVQHDQESALSPEEKMKADLRKLREVYQLDDAAAVSSRSMDESDDDGWTPNYYGYKYIDIVVIYILRRTQSYRDRQQPQPASRRPHSRTAVNTLSHHEGLG